MLLPSQFLPAVAQILPPDRSAGHRDADRRRADLRLQPRLLRPSVAAAHGRPECVHVADGTDGADHRGRHDQRGQAAAPATEAITIYEEVDRAGTAVGEGREAGEPARIRRDQGWRPSRRAAPVRTASAGAAPSQSEPRAEHAPRRRRWTLAATRTLAPRRAPVIVAVPPAVVAPPARAGRRGDAGRAGAAAADVSQPLSAVSQPQFSDTRSRSISAIRSRRFSTVSAAAIPAAAGIIVGDAADRDGAGPPERATASSRRRPNRPSAAGRDRNVRRYAEAVEPGSRARANSARRSRQAGNDILPNIRQ